MDVREVMNRKEGYYAGYSPIYDELQKKAKRLCCEYNMTFPEEEEKRIKILKELFGTYNPSVFVEPALSIKVCKFFKKLDKLCF